MIQEQITQAFENRWRVKAHLDGTGHVSGAVIPFVSSEHQEEILSHIKSLCRDFFEAGILIAQGSRPAVFTPEQPQSISSSEPSPSLSQPSPSPSISSIAQAESLDFSTWWKLYDKKIDRAKCEKKWNKLTLKERQACIAATPAYVASTPDIQYRRHPMTYLNNKSWENQIIPHNYANDKPTTEQQLYKLADILVG